MERGKSLQIASIGVAALLCTAAVTMCCAQSGVVPSSVIIRGRVSDETGAVIVRAIVRVLDATSRQTVETVRSDANGQFEGTGLDTGTYIIAVSATGFTEKLVELGMVKAGSNVSRTVRLQPLDCDAPGVNCDIFSTGPVAEPPPVIARKSLVVSPGDALDLEKGTVAPMQPGSADCLLSAEGSGLYLSPRNKAALYKECGNFGQCGANKTASLRIDGLGPGSKICLRTNHGDCSKLFVTEVIRPGMNRVAISVVTRSK